MSAPEHFDYEPIARQAGISPEQLRQLEAMFLADYPDDAMLRELHILRACNAVKSGRARIEDILKPASGMAA